jgi:hypothetical protein
MGSSQLNEPILDAKEQLSEIEAKLHSSKTTLMEMAMLEKPSTEDFEEFNARFADFANQLRVKRNELV